MAIQDKELIRILKGREDSYILSADALGDRNIVELAKKGYRHLHGISLDKKIYDAPLYTQIKYSVNDKYDTHYPDRMFDVIYSLDPDIQRPGRFIREAQRILDADGLLILNGKLNLKQPTAVALKTSDSGNLLIFRNGVRKRKTPKRINVVIRTLHKNEGIKFTTEIMQERFRQAGIRAVLYRTYGEAPKQFPTIIEWAPGIRQPVPRRTDNIIETHELQRPESRLIQYLAGSCYHLAIGDQSYWKKLKKMMKGQFTPQIPSASNIAALNNKLQQHMLTARSYELARHAHITKYFLMPHCLPKPIEQIMKEAKIDTSKELHIGSFGFAAWYKRYDLICDLAIRLKIRATLLLSINHNNIDSINETEGFIRKLQKEYDGANDGKISIRAGCWTNAQLTRELRKCTHLISTQASVMNVSSTMRFMAGIGRPIISLDNYQAREAQVIRVKSLNDIDRAFLERTRTQLTNMDDGFRYICKVLESGEAKA